ncbi:MAG: efflux RND transporter permease subunit [Elusimicrobiota bacterium]
MSEIAENGVAGAMRGAHAEKHGPSAGAAKGGLPGFAVANSHVVIVACLIVGILGGLSLWTMPKDLLPSANMPAVQVISFYSGMPVTDIAQDLTRRFELYTGQAVGIERQESKSIVGVSIVRNFFNSSVSLDSAIAQTSSLVMSVLRRLPPGTQPPLILPFDPMASVPLALIAVSGNHPEKDLYDTARYQVRNVVQAVPGAMAPTVMGGTVRQAIVYLDSEKLNQYNLSPVEVLDKIAILNTFLPAGDVKIGNLDYQIRSNGMVEKVEDMNAFPLRAFNGVNVSLNAVGKAQDASQIQTNVVTIDGKRQVYVPVYRQPGANSLAVIDQARGALERLHSRFKDYTFTMVADQSVFIRHAIDSITEETLIGGGLAALLVFLFLGDPRATLAILLSLPLAIMAAFLGLQATGQTINAMTLGGLALSIGVLVDNSIVVIENISKKLESGLPARRAAIEGGSEVAMPVLTSTVATLIVFFPIVFLSGIVKVLFLALAKAVIFAMIGSYFAAMTVMPLFASRFLRPTSREEMPSVLAFLQGLVDRLTAAYARALTYALARRKRVLATVVVVLAAAAACSVPFIGTELFPKADAGNFQLDLRLPTGTRIESTQAFAEQMDRKLREWIPASDLKMVISNAGVYYGFPAAYTPNSGSQDVYFIVDLSEDRARTSQYYAKVIREHMKAEYPNVDVGIELGGLLTSAINSGLRSPIDVQVIGPHMSAAHAVAVELAAKLNGLRGAVDVRVQQRVDAPEIKLNIDRQRAEELGLTLKGVIENILSAVSGSTTFSPLIWIDPKSGIDYFLGVQFAESAVSKFEDINRIPIRGPLQNRAVPLGRIAKIENSFGPSEINHVNLDPVVDIYMDAQSRDVGGLSAEIASVIAGTAMPEGYSARVRGEYAEMRKAVAPLGGGFLLAVVLVYLVLVIQFRSYALPLIILSAIPLGLVGIAVMLAVTGTYFSIQAAIGAIFMIGIAVANGVLIIEFIVHHHRDGVSADDAVVRGSAARLRPILMTSLASVFGLIPMAIGYGHGAEANIPLGRAVIGGQLVSVTLTLFVVPLLYRMLSAKERKVLEHDA